MSKLQGVVQTKRRTWDLEKYAKKAAEREMVETQTAPAPTPPGELKTLRPREYEFDFDLRSGKVTAINEQDKSSGGFYCSTCDVLLRDSLSFMDHFNGKKHLKEEGVKFTTEKSSLSDVLQVFDRGKKRLGEKRSLNLDSVFENLDDKIGDDGNTKSAKKQKKKKVKAEPPEEEQLTEEEKQMKEILGFTSFK